MLCFDSCFLPCSVLAGRCWSPSESKSISTLHGEERIWILPFFIYFGQNLRWDWGNNSAAMWRTDPWVVVLVLVGTPLSPSANWSSLLAFFNEFSVSCVVIRDNDTAVLQWGGGNPGMHLPMGTPVPGVLDKEQGPFRSGQGRKERRVPETLPTLQTCKPSYLSCFTWLTRKKETGREVTLDAWCTQLLYDADELEETSRDLSDVFMEACAIYRIVYERAWCTRSVSRCRFVWNVAGAALCHLHATKYAAQRGEKTALCPLSVIRQLYIWYIYFFFGKAADFCL